MIKTAATKDFKTLYLFLIIWGVILCSSGAVTSGYHFTDDHEIVLFDHKLSALQTSLIDVIQERLASDFKIRLRPVYYIHRILVTNILGIKFIAWQLYVLLLASLSCYFLFRFARQFDFNWPEAFLFSVLIFAGGQSEIWWRLGPAETIGIFFLSAALLFMAYAITAERNRIYFEALFLFFALLASLCKESLILILPALAFWKAMLWKEHHQGTWKDAIRDNLSSILILFLITVMNILIILLFLGKTDIEYAGVSGFQISPFAKAAKSLFFRNGLGILALLSVLLILLSRPISQKKALRAILEPFLLLLFVCCPQILLYAKSGIFSRYMLPSTIGFSAFVMYCLRYVRTNSLQTFRLPPLKRRSIYHRLLGLFGIIALLSGAVLFILNWDVPHILGTGLSIFLLGIAILTHLIYKHHHVQISTFASTFKIITGLAILTCLYGVGLLYADARQYAQWGTYSSGILQSIISNTTRETDPILVVANPVNNYEACESIYRYLNSSGNRSDIFFLRTLVQRGDDIFHRHLINSFDDHIREFGGKLLLSQEYIGSHHIVLFLSGTEHLLFDNRVEKALRNYIKQKFGDNLLYIKTN